MQIDPLLRASFLSFVCAIVLCFKEPRASVPWINLTRRYIFLSDYFLFYKSANKVGGGKFIALF